MWEEYERGFGETEGNYWIGLGTLHSITNTGQYKFRAELQSWNGELRWAEYSNFHVASKTDNYRLTITGYNDHSSAPDMMYFNNNQQL